MALPYTTNPYFWPPGGGPHEGILRIGSREVGMDSTFGGLGGSIFAGRGIGGRIYENQAGRQTGRASNALNSIHICNVTAPRRLLLGSGTEEDGWLETGSDTCVMSWDRCDYPRETMGRVEPSRGLGATKGVTSYSLQYSVSKSSSNFSARILNLCLVGYGFVRATEHALKQLGHRLGKMFFQVALRRGGGNKQQLAILHTQQRLNELEAQIREDTFIKPQPTRDVAVEPPLNRPADDIDDDNETPPRLEIKDYYRGKNRLEFKDYKDRMLTLFARHRRYYRKEERKINDAKLYLDAHVKQKWMNNLRGKALKVLRTELDRRNDKPRNYEELLRSLQTIEETMSERRRAIRKGRPATFVGNQRRPDRSSNRRNKRK
ncbi:predicted protein [Histoplasma mississippiense (nom. inval.)]|uniref:predicted protein n=1 Tax=Ajellomyces capsulatus (strain NAm1 / WU24) TaxID=2059318 RepID=UPI000157D3E4|nr:predicted protein [Histoplasma mississippiense (nom. inval.)]EDN04694.1 predicted protein [Histoplasma mississippiense (nom. inval.)]